MGRLPGTERDDSLAGDELFRSQRVPQRGAVVGRTLAFANRASDRIARSMTRWPHLRSLEPLKDRLRARPAPIAVALGLAVPMTLLLAAAWRVSLGWPTMHDLPIMLYLAFLWERFGVLPHAGFFDMNLVGSYLGYRGIALVFGYGPVGLRWADLSLYLMIAGLTWLVLRSLGRLAGWVAAVLFGLVYLSLGPIMSLQREYLMLVPLIAAVVFALQGGLSGWLRALLAGGALGVAMTIKPTALVSAVPLVLFLAFERDAEERAGRLRALATSAGWLALGVVAPLSLAGASLAWMGVLDEFWDIASGYLPLYREMNAVHEVLPAGERASDMLARWLNLGGHGQWLLGAAVGAAALGISMPPGDPRRRQVALLVGMAVAFVLYPVLSGKFWPYHWLPMAYWLVVCTSLAVASLGGPRDLPRRLPALVIFVVLLLAMLRPDQGFGGLLEPRDEVSAPAHEIAAFLGARLEPGDTVQPMDWTKSSVLYGLLMAEAALATSFVYDFHFYHHVSSPYIRQLRRRFVEELDTSNARFVVRGKVGPFPKGRDTSRDFPQLRRLLRRKYRRVADSPAYVILERIDGPVGVKGSR